MKKLLTFLLAALMIVPGLCACGKQDATVVRLNEVTHSVFYAPQYVAMSQGFFAAEGLQVELTNGGGADKVMTAGSPANRTSAWRGLRPASMCITRARPTTPRSSPS